MKKTGNCYNYVERSECPFLRRPRFQSGYTGKAGPETWWMCLRHKLPVRYVKRCELAKDSEAQKSAWIEQAAKEKK